MNKLIRSFWCVTWLLALLPAQAFFEKDAAAAPQIIYGDAMANGWTTSGWSASINAANASPVSSGSRSIAVTYTGAWGGLMFNKANLNTSGFSSFRFYANGASRAGRILSAYVNFSTGGRGTVVRVGGYCSGGSIPANAWTQCNIPLSALGAASRVISSFVIQEEAGAAQPVMYFDQVELVDSVVTVTPAPTAAPTVAPIVTPAPTPVPPPSSSQLIFGDAPVNSWTISGWSTSINAANASPVQSGSRSIAVTYTGAWGGLVFGKANFSTYGYMASAFRFSANGGSKGGRVLSAYVNYSDGTRGPVVSVARFCSGGQIPANAWTTCLIPVTNLSGINRVLSAIVIQEEAGAAQPVMYFDDVQLAGSGGTTATPVPTAVPTAVPTPTTVVTAPTPTPIPVVDLSGGLTVFVDSMVNSWTLSGWSTTFNAANTSPVHSGTRSIAATYTGAWGGLVFSRPNYDTTGLVSLRFYANGASKGGRVLSAYVQYPNGSRGTVVRVAGYCEGGTIPANAWTQCLIPLTAIGAANRLISNVVIQEEAGAAQPVMYFDGVAINKQTAFNPYSTPVPTTVPIVTPAPTPVPTPVPPTGGTYKGDGKMMLAFGGWAWGNVPASAVAAAGFEWFETGYPGEQTANQILRNANVRPFAYINLGELTDDLRGPSGYTGAILRTNTDWGTYLVDVTHQSWKDWLVRRADYAYQTGSRGVKWDVATPDLPPGKTRADVNAAIAEVMQRILNQHPDMKFIFNQGFSFALAYPRYVHGIETEGLFSASSYPTAYLKPWLDPWWWGPQYDQIKQLQRLGIPAFIAEYADPYSQKARDLYNAIVAEGFVPYITSVNWNIRGWGYNVPPGW